MRLRTWRRLVLVIFGALFAAIVYRWISLERLQRVAPAEIPRHANARTDADSAAGD